jgi:hypothetical protein
MLKHPAILAMTGILFAAQTLGRDPPVPEKMLGNWVLVDTWQCAMAEGKLAVTRDNIQFGKDRPIRVRVLSRSGDDGEDTLYWHVGTEENILAYDSANDRVVWTSNARGRSTSEIYERCPS